MKGKKIRNIVSEEITVTDGQLARILYVHKRNPDYISLIDIGLISVNQAYFNLRREEDERISRVSMKTVSKFQA